MPPKRPAPLSDAALSKREGGPDAGAPAGPAGVLGETNAGVPLPVKNTFIDVPSGLTPVHSPGPKEIGLRTAPAQVNFAPGFVQRSVLAGALSPPEEEPPSAPASAAADNSGAFTAASQVPATPSSPGSSPMKLGPLRSGAAVIQRPGFLGQDWPLMTPSPTGASLFSSARYQLFGGPAPVQEATYSALGPSGVGRQGVLATTGPLGAVALGRPPLGQPLSYGASTFSPCLGQGAALPPAAVASAAQAYRDGQGAGRPSAPPATGAAGAAPTRAAPHAAPGGAAAPPVAASGSAPLSRVDQEGSDAENEDGDDDSDAEGHGQQHQPARNPEDIPKPPPGAEHPSLGSATHAEGTCKRCCFFPRNRCNNGYDCDFCHYEHEKRKRKNKKSKKKNKEGAADASGQQGGAGPTPADGDAASTATSTLESSAMAGSADIWSTSYAGGVPQAWHDPLYGQQPPPLPPVVYENTDGSPQWTYQWIDDPRPFPGQFEPAGSYFAPATGLQVGVPAPMPGAEPGPPPVSLPPVQPLYSQPPLPAYDGTAPWSAGAFPGVVNSAWQPPYPAPSYHAMSTDPSAAPQPLDVGSAGSANLAPPPLEAPKLPNELQSGADLAPPPQSAPTLPPNVEMTEEGEDDGKPPPPMSSPKLPNNVLMSFDSDTPPVPGGPPI